MAFYTRKCTCGTILKFQADSRSKTQVKCPDCNKAFRLGWAPHLIEV